MRRSVFRTLVLSGNLIRPKYDHIYRERVLLYETERSIDNVKQMNEESRKDRAQCCFVCYAEPVLMGT